MSMATRDIDEAAATRQRFDRYPDLNHPSTVIYVMGYDAYGPIRCGASFVPWDESLIGVEGDTWRIIDW